MNNSPPHLLSRITARRTLSRPHTRTSSSATSPHDSPLHAAASPITICRCSTHFLRANWAAVAACGLSSILSGPPAWPYRSPPPWVSCNRLLILVQTSSHHASIAARDRVSAALRTSPKLYSWGKAGVGGSRDARFVRCRNSCHAPFSFV